MLDALVVAPHPDDAELGMGGTIVRLIQQGWSVGILDLTSGEPTPLGSPERRAAETAAANAALGNPWRKNLGLPNRSLEPTLLHRRAAGGRIPPGAAAALCSLPTGKMPTRTTPRRPSWLRTRGSGASSPSQTSPASPFHPARILYYFSVHLRIVERPSLVVDISDQLDAKLRLAIVSARNWWTTSRRAGPA